MITVIKEMIICFFYYNLNSIPWNIYLFSHIYVFLSILFVSFVQAMRMKTGTNLAALAKENHRLRRQNNYLENEYTLLQQASQHKKDELKQLKKVVDSQNTVMEELSKLLVRVSPFSSLAVCLTKLLAVYKQQ